MDDLLGALLLPPVRHSRKFYKGILFYCAEWCALGCEVFTTERVVCIYFLRHLHICIKYVQGRRQRSLTWNLEFAK